jgi:hypothetical protein
VERIHGRAGDMRPSVATVSVDDHSWNTESTVGESDQERNTMVPR